MSDIDLVRINGTPYAAESTSFTIAGDRYEGVTDFEYGDKVEASYVWGSRSDKRPIGSTPGKYSVDTLSISMILSSWDRFSSALMVLGLGSISAARFPLVCSFTDIQAQLAGVLPIVVIASKARVVGRKVSRGDGVSIAEVALMAELLTENGKTLAARDAF